MLPHHPSPTAILASAQAERLVIQDFRPLADSIEWTVGQGYFRARGSKAFTTDAIPVPYVINNDGNLSRKAAELLFTALQSHAPDQAPIHVLEIGIGLGLFARFFLDAFEQLCHAHGKDYHDRLCYIAADYSDTILRDAARHGIFANHPGRYLLRQLDALNPAPWLFRDPDLAEAGPQPLRAVFLNYVIDCLPASVLKLDGETITGLHVRTCLARRAQLKHHIDLTPEELIELVQQNDAQAEAVLRRVFTLLASEYAYLPVNPADIPHGDFAVRFARERDLRSVLHNHGAIQSLAHLSTLLRPGGFILINDYSGSAKGDAEHFEHQRFSDATSIGLNFPLLAAFCADLPDCQWTEPDEGESPGICARLLSKSVAPPTTERFLALFGHKHREELQQATNRAHAQIQAGRFEGALSDYRLALEQQPHNWLLMTEVAHFLTNQLGAPAAGLEMAKAALSLNPSCSADLWNTLGDAYFAQGRAIEAETAYLRALRINENDVRARYNLAFVYTNDQRYELALRMLSEGLARDVRGQYREMFLRKQTEVLERLQQHTQQEQLRLANRVSTRLEPADSQPWTIRQRNPSQTKET